MSGFRSGKVTLFALLIFLNSLSAQTINISSLKQVLRADKSALFEGNVDAQLGESMHVWADQITVKEQGNELAARALGDTPLTLEDNNLLMFARELNLNLTHKTGTAKQICLHLGDGFLYATSARKINASDWIMEDIVYTACDKYRPDWHIDARKAVFHGGYFIRMSQVTINTGNVPCFGLPQMVIPVQLVDSSRQTAKSGFLLPRFIFDYDYGFGIRQEYYQPLARNADTTLGVDWHDKKGVVFSDELRWYRSPSSSTNINGYYAIIRDRYLYRKQHIRKGTSRAYWVRGSNSHLFPQIFPKTDASILMRTDFGLDKRIEYYFFNNTSAIDDTFCNSAELRFVNPKHQYGLSIDYNRIVRTRFLALKDTARTAVLERFAGSGVEIKPDTKVSKYIDDHAYIGHAPRLSWSTAFTKLLDSVHVRHDACIDNVLSRQQTTDRLFVDKTLVDEQEPLPYSKTECMRLTYAAQAKIPMNMGGFVLTPYLMPRLQIASRRAQDFLTQKNVIEGRMLGTGGYRAFLEGGMLAALPTTYRTFSKHDGHLFVQPKVSWKMVPKMLQTQWYHSDWLDRAYPTNCFTGQLDMAYVAGKTQFDMNIQQGYDFYPNSDRFLLARSLTQQHIMPVTYTCGATHGSTSWWLKQEYDWPNFQLLQSQLAVDITLPKKWHLGLGYLFQKREMQVKRELLSTIPHFLLASLTIPLSKRATLQYDAQLYAPQRSSLFFFDGIKPLIHRVRLEYDGHCWGCFIGFEEKKFKECGIARNERALVFSLRLDSLGSFAKKFKTVPSYGPMAP